MISRSYCGLQIRPHHFFDTADSGILEQSLKIEFPALLIELKRFQNHVHPYLVAELEAVRQCFLRTVYPDGYSVYAMFFYPGLEAFRRKLMYGNRRIMDSRNPEVLGNGD
ncbi:MAG: hypothetical protein FJ240_04230 [Nitrospira sp.]|nr:hypothetical protein [Nitrospira sp.]